MLIILLKFKVTSSNVLFCLITVPKPKDIQLIKYKNKNRKCYVYFQNSFRYIFLLIRTLL